MPQQAASRRTEAKTFENHFVRQDANNLTQGLIDQSLRLIAGAGLWADLDEFVRAAVREYVEKRV